MDKITDKAARRPSDRKVRMAYSLNNRQPVRCTIVSDQPLFYMDFEGDIEDNHQEPEFGAAAAAARIAALFAQDAETVGTVQTACAATFDNEFEVALLARTLDHSRLAAEFMDLHRQHGGAFVLNDQVETSFYDRATGHIHLNPQLPRAERVLLAARELRRVWQHRNGALIDPLNFHPDQAVLVNRSQIADLAAAMVRVAWELQLSGEKDMWARLEMSPMADLARAFSREAFVDFRTISNGAANCAVFEAWFLSERCSHEDRRLIQQMLADYQSHAFDDAAASKSVSAELIHALGGMPFGRNYLAPYVQTITTDALFTDVRDRSNANFLWFIKFERSFKQAEDIVAEAEAAPTPSADIIELPHAAFAATTASPDGGLLNGRVIQFRDRIAHGGAAE